MEAKGISAGFLPAPLLTHQQVLLLPISHVLLQKKEG